jgi:hypothetical protein
MSTFSSEKARLVNIQSFLVGKQNLKQKSNSGLKERAGPGIPFLLDSDVLSCWFISKQDLSEIFTPSIKNDDTKI